jgi:hypothetical protein
MADLSDQQIRREALALAKICILGAAVVLTLMMMWHYFPKHLYMMR